MAANTRDIRRRIKSVKNTSQITKAMQMVAAAKMRKAQLAALAGRPYAELMNRMLAAIGHDDAESVPHSLLLQRPVHRELVIVVSTDKGLCGALNTNLLREIGQFSDNTDFVACGRKGLQFLVRNKRKVLADFALPDAPSNLDTKPAAKFAMEKFLSGDYDKVSVLYTDFVNTLTQKPRIVQIIPVGTLKAEVPIGEPTVDDLGGIEYQFEPDAQQVLEAILPHYVQFQFFQMVLDARASEHSSRMVAMKNATDNAKQLIKDLTLEYNKIRQASITTEILEIASAQIALG